MGESLEIVEMPERFDMKNETGFLQLASKLKGDQWEEIGKAQGAIEWFLADGQQENTNLSPMIVRSVTLL